MNNFTNQLDYIINIEKFQKIQDDIAKATDMAVIAIDFSGHPITEHSQCSKFCKAVRNNPELEKLCEKCDSRGGLEAARNHEPYIYLCHIGIVDFAIPISVDGQYLGAIMAGQVRLKNEENNNQLEQIVSKKYQQDINAYPELKKLYDQLHVMPIEKIEAISHMINHLINYIVGEAVLKNSLYDINQKLTDFTKDQIKSSEMLQHKTHLYYPVTEPESNKNYEELNISHRYSLLKPALLYIDENYKDKIYLDNMAYLCNISPSYFSKIFKRETGENFSNYVNKVKVEHAKLILESSNDSINNISLDFGFDDCGYFIKVFKKICGETPASYRKFNNE